MRVRFKRWYANSKNKLNMTKFIVVSIFLLLAVWLIDVKVPFLKYYVPDYLLLPLDVSKTFLSSLSGVFLTVTTFSFGTILTVLNGYSSNFTPRSVQKFVDKPYVLSLIGIFIGGFFYTVLSLFFLHGLDPEKSFLAGTIGILYAVVSMAYLVHFMQRVLRDRKGSYLIQDLFDEGMRLVEEEAKNRKKSERYRAGELGEGIKIFAKGNGYLFGIDYERLFLLLKDFKGELVIRKKIGEYVSPGLYLAELYLEEAPDGEENRDFLKDLSNCFLYSDQRNETQDYHHELTILVEIALRGLSPGINDPNTAINCIRKISLLLGQLFSTKNHFITARENDHMKVVYTSYSVKEELYLTFYQILHYGKEDPSVVFALLEGLTMIRLIADNSAGREVLEYFEHVYTIVEPHMANPMDAEHLHRLRDTFRYHSGELAEKEAMRKEEE